MFKLTNAEKPLANFFAQGVLRLGRKLGPILWQFPPQFAFNPEKLQSFFNLLPRTQSEAATLARAHDQRLKGDDHGWSAKRIFRYVTRSRSGTQSCECPEFITLIRRTSDWAGCSRYSGVAVADGCDC